MSAFIQWILMNFGLAMFVLAFVIIFASMKFSKLSIYELTYRWVAFLPLGVSGLYNFIMHGFFGNFTASAIGWQNSPFQWEVAVANLGVGIIGIFAFKASAGFRKAVVIMSACWLWGDAIGHVNQMMTQHNFTTGNAGSWFWMDIIVPALLWFCLVRMKIKA